MENGPFFLPITFFGFELLGLLGKEIFGHSLV